MAQMLVRSEPGQRLLGSRLRRTDQRCSQHLQSSRRRTHPIKVSCRITRPVFHRLCAQAPKLIGQFVDRPLQGETQRTHLPMDLTDSFFCFQIHVFTATVNRLCRTRPMSPLIG